VSEENSTNVTVSTSCQSSMPSLDTYGLHRFLQLQQYLGV
jgi:hypothetical protein